MKKYLATLSEEEKINDFLTRIKEEIEKQRKISLSLSSKKENKPEKKYYLTILILVVLATISGVA